MVIVEVEGAGAPPVVTPVEIGGLVWRQLEREARGPGELSSLRRELESVADPGKTLLAVEVSGLLVAEERGELEHMEQLLASRFLWGTLSRSGLRPSPEDDSWLEGLPAGIVRQTAGRLRGLAAGEGPEAEVAARALVELYAVAGEAAP